MDLAYWNFRRWPFERSMETDRFFWSPLHEEAMARLLFLVEEFHRTGIMVGAAGTGKTFLLKLLQRNAERQGRLTVRADATGLDGQELTSAIAAGCLAACEPDATSARTWNSIHKRFAALAIIQQPVVITIDHFDSVDFRCHQAVGRLRQLADSLGVKLTMILATRSPIIPDVLQDFVELRIDVGAWEITQTEQFIQWSIEKAGTQMTIFTAGAVELIHEVSHGIPAAIVTLCNLALLAAGGRDEKLVSSKIVEAAYRELMPLPADHVARQRSDDDLVKMSSLIR